MYRTLTPHPALSTSGKCPIQRLNDDGFAYWVRFAYSCSNPEHLQAVIFVNKSQLVLGKQYGCCKEMTKPIRFASVIKLTNHGELNGLFLFLTANLFQAYFSQKCIEWCSSLQIAVCSCSVVLIRGLLKSPNISSALSMLLCHGVQCAIPTQLHAFKRRSRGLEGRTIQLSQNVIQLCIRENQLFQQLLIFLVLTCSLAHTVLQPDS